MPVEQPPEQILSVDDHNFIMRRWMPILLVSGLSGIEAYAKAAEALYSVNVALTMGHAKRKDPVLFGKGKQELFLTPSGVIARFIPGKDNGAR